MVEPHDTLDNLGENSSQTRVTVTASSAPSASLSSTGSGSWVTFVARAPADLSWKALWLRGPTAAARLAGDWRARSVVTGFAKSGESY